MIIDTWILYILPVILAGLVAGYFTGWRKIMHRIHEFHHPYAWIIAPRVKRRLYLKRVIDLLFIILIISMILLAMGLPRDYIVKNVFEESSIYGSVSFKRRIPVVIVLDTSGSMSGVKFYYATRAVVSFLDNVGDSVLVGLITFDGDIKRVVPPTTDRDKIYRVLKSERPSGGTIYSIPLKTALEWLKPYREFNLSAFVIFVTDGLPYPDDMPEYRKVLEGYENHSIPIYAIFIETPGSPDINSLGEAVVQEIAYTTGGDWYSVENAEQLIPIFQDLAEQAVTLSGNYTLRYGVTYYVKTPQYHIHIPATIAFILLTMYYLMRTLLYKTMI